jgi:hypothetical protein
MWYVCVCSERFACVHGSDCVLIQYMCVCVRHVWDNRVPVCMCIVWYFWLHMLHYCFVSICFFDVLVSFVASLVIFVFEVFVWRFCFFFLVALCFVECFLALFVWFFFIGHFNVFGFWLCCFLLVVWFLVRVHVWKNFFFFLFYLVRFGASFFMCFLDCLFVYLFGTFLSCSMFFFLETLYGNRLLNMNWFLISHVDFIYTNFLCMCVWYLYHFWSFLWRLFLAFFCLNSQFILVANCHSFSYNCRVRINFNVAVAAVFLFYALSIFRSSKKSILGPFLTLFWTPIFGHFWPFLDPCFLVIFDPFFGVVTCKFLFVTYVIRVTCTAWKRIFCVLAKNPILPHLPSYFDRLDIGKPSPCK